MNAKHWSYSLLLAGALILGCDDKKVDQPKADNTPAKSAANDAKNGMDKAAETAKNTADSATDSVKNAADSTKSAAADAARKASDSTKSAGTDAAKTASDSTKGAVAGAAADTADIKTQANDWLAKAQAAMTSGKLTDVKGYLEKLESYKSKLPADVQTKIDALKTSYDAAMAKAAAVPNLNK